VVTTPLLPLADAYGLRGLAERRRAYGPVRLWGSVSFIIANLGGGVVLQAAGAGNLIWVLVAIHVVMAASALWLPPMKAERPGSGSGARPGGSLWRDRVFLAVVVGASLIQAGHAVLYGFGTLLWSARGLEGSTIGLLWGLGVVVEIALFAVSGRVVPAVGPIGMIVLGALGSIVRWGAMAFDPPAILLPLLQCLHALSFGATHLGTMAVLSNLAGRGRGATAQGDFAAVQGLTFAGAMSLSGVLVEAYGIAAYAAMALLAAVGGVIALSARRYWSGADRA
jgi:MFS transporter, PPP family, 3-phenylpropionic acid transporter